MSTTEADLLAAHGVDELPWHLKGNYGPVEHELDVAELEVEGEIPAEIDGVYMRNGFNPQSGWSDHWFFGDGMIHAVDIRGGKASLRNRYVRTRAFESGQGAMSMDPADSPANTNIIRHAGRYFALEEAHGIYEVTEQLDTVGFEDFGGGIGGPFTAHPKLCPSTGELLGFGYNVAGPRVSALLPLRRRRLARAVRADHPSRRSDDPRLQHHASQGRVDGPAGLLLDGAGDGRRHAVLLEPRQRRPPRCDAPRRRRRRRDLVRHRPRLLPPPGQRVGGRRQGRPCSCAARSRSWTVASTTCPARPSSGAGRSTRPPGTVTEEHLDDRKSDFPRVDDRRVGLPTRFGYTQQLGNTPDNPSMGNEVYKYDLDTG